MANGIKLLGLTLLAQLAVGCAITPPLTSRAEMCNFKRHHLAVEIPGYGIRKSNLAPLPALSTRNGSVSLGVGPGASRQHHQESSFGEALLDTLSAPELHGSDAAPSMLFLSGGSQNGAFGAGFLQGWSEDRRQKGKKGLPRFKAVTGVSTGAILSTFAFLGDTETPARSYRVSREADILQGFVRSDAGTLRTALTVGRRGAVGDLVPLRRRLREELTDRVLRAVAEEGQERKLFVGAVDLDTGQAVAFDMTDMAQQFAKAGNEGDRGRIRDCYVEAIAASSAVPMAALPVFIDNRMYIDGGARFGMFSDEIGEVLREYRLKGGSAPRYYVVVNGDLSMSERCGKVDEALCRPPNPSSGALEGQHKDWSLDALAFRSVQILINQGYRFAAAHLQAQADRKEVPLHLARIEPDIADHRYRLRDHSVPEYRPHPVLGVGEMTCPQWFEQDKIADKPLEFHPRYMHCLVDYGERKARAARWADHD